MLRVDDSSSSSDSKCGNDIVQQVGNTPAVQALEASANEYVIADLSKGPPNVSGVIIDWDFVHTADLERALEETAIKYERDLYIYYRTGGQ